MVSVTKTPLGHCTVKAALDKKSTNESGWVPIKLYLQTQVASLWIVVCQPLGEIIEETKLLFIFTFKGNVLIFQGLFIALQYL